MSFSNPTCCFRDTADFTHGKSLGPNAQWTRGATPKGDNKQWEVLKIWDTTLVKIVRMTLTWLYTEKRENKKNKKFFMAVLCEFSSYPHLLNDIIIHRTELINNALLFKVLLNYLCFQLSYFKRSVNEVLHMCFDRSWHFGFFIQTYFRANFTFNYEQLWMIFFRIF